MRREAARKAFHVASVALPLAVLLLREHRRLALAGLAAVAATALVVEALRHRYRPARYHFLRRTRVMLRPHERRGLAGATYMAVAYALALLLFPVHVAVAAMLYNGLGDAAAALVGKRWGRHRTPWGKSWEGFAAALGVCLAVGVAVGAAVSPIPFPAALGGALVAAAVELAPLPVDDNVRVTLLGGAALWAGTALFT